MVSLDSQTHRLIAHKACESMCEFFIEATCALTLLMGYRESSNEGTNGKSNRDLMIDSHDGWGEGCQPWSHSHSNITISQATPC